MFTNPGTIALNALPGTAEGARAEEEAWIAASLDGDRDAFAELVRRYQARVFRLAGRFADESLRTPGVTAAVGAVVRVLHEQVEVLLHLAQVIQVDVVHGRVGTEDVRVLLQVLAAFVRDQPQPGFVDDLPNVADPLQPLCDGLLGLVGLLFLVIALRPSDPIG